jgi:hypothetical protein
VAPIQPFGDEEKGRMFAMAPAFGVETKGRREE